MENNQFENLLGKNVSVAKKVIGDDFENKLFGNEFYYISDESIKKDFYGVPYNFLTILTSDKSIVQSITTHFHEVVNHDFYDLFIIDYGSPDTIQIIESKKIISEGTLKDKSFTQKLTKSNAKLREGRFDENPLFIMWKKKNYQIKILMRHEENRSEITFSMLTE